MEKRTVHMNLNNPYGTITLEELMTLKEESMRATAIRALEKGYVVTINIDNEDGDSDYEFRFDGKDQVMTMGEFFDIIEASENESSK